MADAGVFSWPPTAGTTVPTYANLAAFPSAASAGDGSLAIALDTHILYESNGSAWLVIGGPGAALSIGTFDSGSASANGAHIDTNALIMQSASATVPGLVNLSTQTFAGNKTFTGTIAASNLSGTNTGNVTLAAVGAVPNANGASLSGQILNLQPANTSFPGALTAADWNTFNNKQNALTFGNLTDVGTDGIVVTGGTGAVIGSGTSIAQQVADTTHNGYLSSTDWNTFNGKQSTVTVGALDAQAANAQGLALVSNVLSTQSADATHPGMVNTTTQTMAGAKTFSTSVTSPIFSSSTANPSGAGVLRLANTNTIGWRNAGNSANITLQIDGSNNLNLSAAGFTQNGSSSGTFTQSPAATTTSYSILWPSAQGASGSLLQNNGSGTLSWGIAGTAAFSYPTSGSAFGGVNGTIPALTGVQNTAVGQGAGLSLSSGRQNTLFGDQAGANVTTASFNTFIGAFAGGTPTSSASNTCIGNDAGTGLTLNTNGGSNVLIGSESGATVTDGAHNVGVGTACVLGASVLRSIVVGDSSVASANDSVLIGTGLTLSGKKSAAFGSAGTVASTTSVSSADGQISFGTQAFPLKDLFLGKGADTATVTSASNCTIQPSPVSGSNQAGGSLTITGGNGTGTGGSGAIFFQTAAVAGSSSTANTLKNRGGFDAAGLFNLFGSTSGQFNQSATAATTSYGIVWPGAQGGASTTISNDGSGNLSWASILTNPMTTGGDLIYGGASGTPTRLANGSSGQLLQSAGGTSAPVWGPSFLTFASYTPTLVGFGTTSAVNFSFMQFDKVLLIRGNFTSGTSTATEARCPLPAGYTVAGSSIVPTIALCGYGTWNFNSANIPAILIETGVTYLTFGAQGAGLTGLTKLNGSSFLTTGQGLSFFAIVPIA
jgi:hypothetical protein